MGERKILAKRLLLGNVGRRCRVVRDSRKWVGPGNRIAFSCRPLSTLLVYGHQLCYTQPDLNGITSFVTVKVELCCPNCEIGLYGSLHSRNTDAFPLIRRRLVKVKYPRNSDADTMIIDLLTFDSGSSSRSTLVRHIWKETKRKKKLNHQSIKSLYSNEQASFNGVVFYFMDSRYRTISVGHRQDHPRHWMQLATKDKGTDDLVTRSVGCRFQ